MRDPQGLNLNAVTLPNAPVEQLAPIPVLGLPTGATSDQLLADYYQLESGMHGDAGIGGMLTLVTLDDEIYLYTPLMDPQGGSIVVVITDGKSRSKAFGLDLKPLPAPQSGILETFIDQFDDLLRAATEELGMQYPQEWEGWRDGSFNQMPEFKIPLMRSYLAVLDPKNENSLVNVTQALKPEERELLERIMAGSDLIDVVNDWTQMIESGETVLTKARNLGPLHALGTSQVMSFTPDAIHSTLASTNSSGDDNTWRTPGVPPIANGSVLALQLELYHSYRGAERTAELVDDTLGAVLRGIALVLAIPTKGGSSIAVGVATRKATVWVSSAISGVGTLSGVAQWFLPCCIADLDVELDPADGVIVYEDAQPNQVEVASALAVAESHGVDVTREIADRLITLVTKSALSDAATTLYGENAKDLIMDAGVTPALETFLTYLPPGADMVFVWEDIDLMQGGRGVQDWLEVEADTFGSGGRPILERVPTAFHLMEFKLVLPEAFERTDSLLRFKTNYDNLPAPAAIDTKPVSLKYIEIEFDPPGIRIKEDDMVVPFKVIVHNALDAFIELPLEVDPPLGEILRMPSSEPGVYEFHYLPPDDFPPGQIARIRARASSLSGIRHTRNNPPARMGVMHITAEAERFEIQPGTACLDNNDTLQLEALDPITGEAVAVNWQSNHGTITQQGLYRAPSSGFYQTRVTAISQTDPSITASATLAYGSCECWWQGRVTGKINQSHGWNSVLLRLDAESRIVALYQQGLHDHANNRYYYGFNLDLSDNPIPAGATGSYQAKLGAPLGSPLDVGVGGNFTTDSVNQWPNLAENLAQDLGLPWPRLMLTIHEHEMIPGGPEGSRWLRASVGGQVMQYDPNQNGQYEVGDTGILSAEIRGNYSRSYSSTVLQCDPWP